MDENNGHVVRRIDHQFEKTDVTNVIIGIHKRS